MSTYRKGSEEILVCDGCGVDETGSKPDLTGFVKFDLTAELRAAGFPQGTAATVTDTCPACTAKRSKRATP